MVYGGSGALAQSGPVTLSIVDVAGNLALTQKAIENYRDKNPGKVSRVVFTKATSPELPGKIKAQQDANRVDIDLVLTGNDALAADYARLNARFDHLTFLAVPGIEAVRRWRADQEQSLPADRRMSAAALARFIAHYERLTRWMLADVPARADLTVELKESHDVKRLAFRDH